MIELIRLVSLLIDIRRVHTELGLSDNHVAVLEVHHKVAIRGFEAVFYSRYFEFFAGGGFGCLAH